MDIKNVRKPIHFTCPKCHADFEFNGGDIVRRKNELREELNILLAKMQTRRNEYGKDSYYKHLSKLMKDKQVEYGKAKKAVQIASEQSEIHLFILFKAEMRKLLGDEVVDKILQECEDELSYRVYDMAIQNHNNFDGA